jgi:hypothetical protein
MLMAQALSTSLVRVLALFATAILALLILLAVKPQALPVLVCSILSAMHLVTQMDGVLFVAILPFTPNF